MLQKTTQETPQLIKVVRPGDMNIFSDVHFGALSNCRNAENDHGYLLTQLRTPADTPGSGNNISP